MQLVFIGGSREQMNKDMITENEIAEVIEYAEKTKTYLINPQTSRFISHKRIGAATCWAEYVLNGDKACIYKVYAHRIAIKDDK